MASKCPAAVSPEDKGLTRTATRMHSEGPEAVEEAAEAAEEATEATEAVEDSEARGWGGGGEAAEALGRRTADIVAT